MMRLRLKFNDSLKNSSLDDIRLITEEVGVTIESVQDSLANYKKLKIVYIFGKISSVESFKLRLMRFPSISVKEERPSSEVQNNLREEMRASCLSNLFFPRDQKRGKSH